MANVKSVAAPCLVVTLILSHHWTSISAGRPRPSLIPKSHLVLEMLDSKPCPEVPDNALVFDPLRIGLRNKVDYVLNGEFNITRSAPAIEELVSKLTKCRDSVSSNTCENFQTWRLKKGVCKMLVDPNAVWKDAWNAAKPRMDCPIKPGHYAFDNWTFDTSLLQVVPFQWEGNVWQIHIAFMETAARAHVCAKLTFRVHRVRTEPRGWQ